MTIVEVSLIDIHAAFVCWWKLSINCSVQEQATAQTNSNIRSVFLPLADAFLQLGEDAAVEGVDLGEYTQYLS